MSESFKSFEELDCWKRAKELKIFILEVVKELPKEERFDLADNMRRAARSCTRNIAEGFGRFHYQENIQFCRISRGSMFELWDDLISCNDDNYISPEKYADGVDKIKIAIKVLNGYIFYLEKAKTNISKKN